MGVPDAVELLVNFCVRYGYRIFTVIIKKEPEGGGLG